MTLETRENQETENNQENPELAELETYARTRWETKELEKSIIDSVTEAWNKMKEKTSAFWEKVKAIPLFAGLFKDKKETTNWNTTEQTTYQTYQGISIEQYTWWNLAKKLSNVILFWESWYNYWAVNKNDVGSVSIWLMQRHAQRAVDVLKDLRNVNPTKFDTTMKDPIFRNLNTAWMSKWNDTQANQFKTLMKDTEFQTKMRNIVEWDCQKYVDTIKKRWVSDERCILVLWRIYNAGPALAKKVFNKVWVCNDYNKYISAFKTTSYVAKRWNLFDKKVWNWNLTLAQQIWNNQTPTRTYMA